MNEHMPLPGAGCMGHASSLVDRLPSLGCHLADKHGEAAQAHQICCAPWQEQAACLVHLG